MPAPTANARWTVSPSKRMESYIAVKPVLQAMPMAQRTVVITANADDDAPWEACKGLLFISTAIASSGCTAFQAGWHICHVYPVLPS